MLANQKIIRIGLQNEAADSDSLYEAFTKTKDNFAAIWANASSGVTQSITANATAVDVGVTTSYFAPGASTWTSTMPAGTEGQFKSLIKAGSGGQVTVTAAGATSTVILLNGNNAGCYLQFISGKWFCLGINGGTVS